jgi:hypothetical protein
MKVAGLDPDHEYLFDMDNIYGTFNIAVEYTQSFSNNKIAECLFGPAVASYSSVSSTTFNNGCCSPVCNTGCDDSVIVNVVGSQAPTPANGTSDLLADNFFLPVNFSSSITFSPKISNVLVPMQLYVGLDEWCNGLYFRVYAPITWTRWKLEANETIVNRGTVGTIAGDISPVAVPASSLYQSFLSYTSGNSITIPSATPPGSVTVNPLKVQLIGNGCQAETKTGLADLRAELGWNFLLDECYHLGVNIQMAAPTGNKCSDSCFLFAPIVGNDKHWELGGGVTGSYTFWRSEDDEQEFGFYVEADITHIFKKSENRVFDLIDNPLSRYMFAQQLTKADPTLTVGGTAATVQFANVFTPIANISMQNVDVSFDVQGDVLAKFVYTCRGFSWELGYNFWGRSCQKVAINCDCPSTFPSNMWALGVGCNYLYGFEPDTTIAHPLQRTASGQTVFACASIDNPATPVVVTVDATPTTLELDPDSTGDPVNGSNPPIALTAADFDISAGTRGISNKVFTHFNYTWIDCEDWIPYVGIGASAEFGSTGERGNNNNNTVSSTAVVTNGCNTGCNTTCNTNNNCGNKCSDCSISQWAVWIKGGLSFN